MTPANISKTINSNSRVLLATHQFGIPMDIEAAKSISKKHKLFLIEDAASAFGARIDGRLVGSTSDATLLSFDNTKVISGISGGCLIVRNNKLADKIRKVKTVQNASNTFSAFGKNLSYKLITENFLYNFSFPLWTTILGRKTQEELPQDQPPIGNPLEISSLAASLVVEQLGDLDNNVERRNYIAKQYIKALSNISGIELPKISSSKVTSWVRFPIRVENKENFFKKAIDKGLDLTWTFSYSSPRLYGLKVATPNADLASKTVLGLPIFPSLKDSEVKKIISIVKQIA